LPPRRISYDSVAYALFNGVNPLPLREPWQAA
jgi:hypothetical protein